MDDNIPSISSGSVGSRFVSQTDLDTAKQNREAQWKAAYERLGQDPPPRPQEDPEYDGRSLYERLQSQKTAKQEEWDEKTKLSNQFRALEEDEIIFLDSVMEEKRAEERSRRDQDSEQVKLFKEAVAERNRTVTSPPVSSSISPNVSSSSTPALNSTATAITSTTASRPPNKAPPKTPSLGKKDQKTLLKGIVKPKRKDKPLKGTIKSPLLSDSDATNTHTKKRGADEEQDGHDEAKTKRARVDDGEP